MKNTSDWIALFSLIISSSIAFFALIVSGITAFYAYKVYQATQEQLELATSSAKTAEKIANEQLELARQDANNSAEAAKQQKFVSCVEMYAKIYAEKALFFEQFIEKSSDEAISQSIHNINQSKANQDSSIRIIYDLNIFNSKYTYTPPSTWWDSLNQQDKKSSIVLWLTKVFICEIQSFIDAVLILEQQLNDDERKKFYAIVSVSSSEFIESFEMINSLENYTPTNKTAFDNTQRVFKALQNKKQ
ncbi:MAG: hypothetical protein RL344_238 [Pseudomonadota bacterium]|jgi:hypothetical protein